MKIITACSSQWMVLQHHVDDMNDPVERLVVHLRDAAPPGGAGHPEMADGGGAGGEEDLVPGPGDDGEGPGREGSGDESALTEVPEEGVPQQEGVSQDCLELECEVFTLTETFNSPQSAAESQKLSWSAQRLKGNSLTLSECLGVRTSDWTGLGQ